MAVAMGVVAAATFFLALHARPSHACNIDFLSPTVNFINLLYKVGGGGATRARS